MGEELERKRLEKKNRREGRIQICFNFMVDTNRN